ncbi:UNVERIFIED_CONTAM: hypothetical protein HDU68_006919 [Siphonaria sp. JEL0065]|nr:hypothetical protein HDU68_006919 [Siphonaria sp. JEL0065]
MEELAAQNARLQRDLDEALKEINEYRKILCLEPKATVANPASAWPTCENYLTRLPMEVLDMIIYLVSADSIVNFFIAIDRIDVADAITNVYITQKLTMDELWPVFQVPESRVYMGCLHHLFEFSKYLNRFGGSASIHLDSYNVVDSFKHVIPKKLKVTVGDFSLLDLLEEDVIIQELVVEPGYSKATNASAWKFLHSRPVTCFTVWVRIPDALLSLLPTLLSLTEVRIHVGQGGFPCQLLKDCRSSLCLVHLIEPQYRKIDIVVLSKAVVDSRLKRVIFSDLGPGRAATYTDSEVAQVLEKGGWSCDAFGFREVVWNRIA